MQRDRGCAADRRGRADVCRRRVDAPGLRVRCAELRVRKAKGKGNNLAVGDGGGCETVSLRIGEKAAGAVGG